MVEIALAVRPGCEIGNCDDGEYVIYIKEFEMMAKLMDNWNGSMDLDSVAATVYTFIFDGF